MSATFDKLKAMLAEKGTLSNEEINAAVEEHGALSDEEMTWLESEKLKVEKESGDQITMDQYLEALNTLDSAEAGSDEHTKAETIVQRYESGG